MEHEKHTFEESLTPEERRIDVLLHASMHVESPAGLVDRVASASMDALLEGQLEQALAVDVPSRLASNVFDVSVNALPQPKEVIGQIAPSVPWRKLAMAACVVFAVVVALRFGTNQQPDVKMLPIVVAEALSVEEEGLLLEDLQLEEYDYLSGTRELAYAEVADSLSSLRNDIELWHYGLLTE
jgi:hypothetical protein